MSLLCKRDDFTFGKSYNMIAIVILNCPIGHHNEAKPL